jgi:GNAT superfamily N-acetyltransferase
VAADRPAADLLPAFRAAHPPGPPDHDPEPEAHLEATLAGTGFGPLLDCSGLALDAEGRVIGAILITDIGGEPPFKGPWVIEVFRDPAHPGTGRALLERALHRGAGLPGLGLAVTEGNHARGLYAALGFRTVFSTLAVDI